MYSNGIFIALCLKFIGVENAMTPLNYPPPDIDEATTLPDAYENDMYVNPFKVIGLKDLKQTTIGHDYELDLEQKQMIEHTKKPCSVVVVANSHNSAMQSLLRKYRYDANGVLIPSSVKYYIKLPQGFGGEPLLLPLTGKAISPLGGYVRYYKEVPPIPPSL